MEAVTAFDSVGAAYAAHSDSARGRLRHDLVERQLLADLPAAPARVLDVGCGNGEMTLRLAAAGHQVTGADPAATMLAAAADRLAARPELADRVRLVNTGFEVLPFDGELFDAVCCHGVLMYLDDPGPAVARLAGFADLPRPLRRRLGSGSGCVRGGTGAGVGRVFAEPLPGHGAPRSHPGPPTGAEPIVTPTSTVRGAAAEGAAALPLRTNRSFRAYWVGEAVTLAGSSVHGVALPVVAVLELDAFPGQVSLLATAATVPAFVLALPAGVAGDRYPKKKIMIGSDLAAAVAVPVVPVCWAAGVLSVPVLYAVALLLGALTVLHQAASIAIVPEIVDRAHMHPANARTAGAVSLADTAPTYGGTLVVGLLGAVRALWLDSLSYLVSALCASGSGPAQHDRRRLTGPCGWAPRSARGSAT